MADVSGSPDLQDGQRPVALEISQSPFLKNLWKLLNKALLGTKMKMSLQFYIHSEVRVTHHHHSCLLGVLIGSADSRK